MKRNLHAGGERRDGARLTILSDDEITEIHLATLAVLEHTGVWVEDEEARATFAAGGAEVDGESGMVRLPPYLVEEAVRAAPSRLVLGARDPRHDLVLEPGRVGFTNFGEGIQVVDPYTGEVREPTLADFANAARLADGLDSVDVYEKAISVCDVPQETAVLYQAEATLTTGAKHGFMGSGDGFLTRVIVRMAEAVAGGAGRLRARPLLTFITCPVSPLKLVKECCEIIMESARAGMAVNVLSMAMAGGSSPVTLAGTLVTHNAEVLSGLTLAQLTRKGAKVIYGSSTTAMDLRLAAASVGTPECALISGAVAQLARHYLLPSWVAGG
jgi:trimethylamine--corrinoid protein Co-methyltransferase